jgi:hypothetical protein
LTNKHYGQILGTIATLLSHFHRLGAQAQGCLLEWLQIVSAQIADQQLRTIKKVFIFFKYSKKDFPYQDKFELNTKTQDYM